MEARTRVELRKSTVKLALQLVRHVKEQKLSGQVLKNRTGTLRRSITHKVAETPQEIKGTVGTNVSYARPHEFGYKGQTLITQAFGRQLKFPVWKSINLPQRSFLRSSLREKADAIRTEYMAAVKRGTA
jgi:phage gpG-like protein